MLKIISSKYRLFATQTALIAALTGGLKQLQAAEEQVESFAEERSLLSGGYQSLGHRIGRLAELRAWEGTPEICERDALEDIREQTRRLRIQGARWLEAEEIPWNRRKSYDRHLLKVGKALIHLKATCARLRNSPDGDQLGLERSLAELGDGLAMIEQEIASMLPASATEKRAARERTRIKKERERQNRIQQDSWYFKRMRMHQERGQTFQMQQQQQQQQQ